MNQLSSETTVDARSFMVYVERPEQENEGVWVPDLNPTVLSFYFNFAT